ncbi:MAG TPA: DUF998 domain-containing protein [Jiangellales bacterium]|nr:DUF998 domain-containing protein [Jiangellales bacterium]
MHPRRLVQTWRVLMDPAMTAEGFTRLTYEIAEGQGGITTLTVTHDWIQITNFVVTGVLTLALATGMRQVLRPGPGGTWGPLLIGVNGVSMTVSAVFLGRPINGYPLGTAEQTTWHGIVHSAAPALAGLAGLAAYFVFARRFASIGQRK